MKQIIATIAPYVIDILDVLILALVSWLAARAATWIKAHTQNMRTQWIMLRLDNAARVAVNALEQTMVTAAKASAANGKLGPEMARNIKAAATELIKTQLGEKGIAELASIAGFNTTDELAQYISPHIEAAVGRLPSSSTIIAQTPSIHVVPTTPIKA